jgi:hypothetical protein
MLHCHACNGATRDPEWPFLGLFGAFPAEACCMLHETAATPATPDAISLTAAESKNGRESPA